MPVKPGALFVLIALFVGCGSPTPTSPAVGPSVLLAPTPLATSFAPPSASPSARPSAPPSVDLSVETVAEVVYSGDITSFTVYASAASSPVAVPIAAATVDFGDGSQMTADGSCTGSAPLLAVAHVYTTARPYRARVSAARLCDSRPGQDLDGTGLLVLPAAPQSTRDWPTCSTFQLKMSGIGMGAGLGNAGELFRLQNRSSTGCVLDGYPGIRLVSRAGAILHAVVSQAVDGDYLFPAIPAHRVALAPGGHAAIDLGYGDNPSGPGTQPYDLACPAARWVRIVIPGTRQFGTAEVAIAPCDGKVNVSAIFPGRDWISFQ